MLVRPSLAALALLPVLSACGGDREIAMPPLTPEPSGTLLIDGSGDRETLPARLVLYRFLRGVAAADVRVCAHLAPSYERTAFGRTGGCRDGLRRARARLDPQSVAALRGVTVPTGETGPGDGDFTVRFEDLEWRGEPARPGGLLAPAFTLHQTRERWLITA